MDFGSVTGLTGIRLKETKLTSNACRLQGVSPLLHNLCWPFN